MDFLPIKRAILSVTDKTDLTDFARFLAKAGVTLYSTGGTYKILQEAGLQVTPINDVTGFPEIMGGRVKTLHPHIHAGILADKENKEHMHTLKELDISPFDLICVNLYNFAEAAEKGLEPRTAIEKIDIGGPAMLRAAAKNYHSILVAPDPRYYQEIIDDLKAGTMQASLPLRRRMAGATFAKTSAYDKMIAAYFEN